MEEAVEKEIEHGVGDFFVVIMVRETGQVFEGTTFQSYFLVEFPSKALLDGFARIQETTGKCPFTLSGIFGPFDDEQLSVFSGEETRDAGGRAEVVFVSASVTVKTGGTGIPVSGPPAGGAVPKGASRFHVVGVFSPCEASSDFARG